MCEDGKIVKCGAKVQRKNENGNENENFFLSLHKITTDMKKIIGIGNALTDVLVRLQDDESLQRLGLPKGGMQLIDDARYEVLAKEMLSLSPVRSTGGSAGNAVLALSHLGAPTGFIGRIGDDETGRFFRDTYQQAGIDTRLILTSGRSGVANTFITPDGERTFATYLGAAAGMTAADITPRLFEGCELLHIEGYLVQNHEMIERVCRMAKEAGLQTSIDLASYNVVSDHLRFFRQLVTDYIDIVFANEEESATFTGTDNAEKALESIASLCRVAVVKLGKRGSSGMTNGRKAYAPGSQVGVVDTTAAGDFFAGGFLYAWSLGLDLERCLRAGALLSANIIQVVGTRLPDETWQQIRVEMEKLR